MHATAIVLGDRGVLIAGDSGSGKSTLALALIAHFQTRGLFARLVSDDQVFLTAHAGRVIGTAPSSTQGLVEVWGIGPQAIGFESRIVVDLVVRLSSSGSAERFAEEAVENLAGCPVPCLGLAGRHVTGALMAVVSRLSLPPFV